jgi:peptide/nickel transport system substrate-binding protein
MLKLKGLSKKLKRGGIPMKKPETGPGALGGEKKISRRKFLKMTGKAGLAAGIAGSLASFPTIIRSAPNPAEEGILRIARQKDAISLDPYKITDPYTRQVYENIMDHLIYTDPDMNILGQLATSWKMVDDVTYRFELRKGVKFPTGRPFTSADVKYSFDRLMGFLPNVKPGRPSTFLQGIKSISVDGDHTAIFTSKGPYGAFLNDLTAGWALIMDREGVEKWGQDFGNHPSSVGPFMLEEWKPGDYLTLKRFDGYWAGAPRLKKVIWKVIPEDSTRLLAFENNEVDMIYLVPPHEVARLKKDPRVQVIEGPTFRTFYVMMNVKKEPFGDKKVRQACCHAVGGERILKTALEGVGILSKTFFAPEIFGAADVGMYDYNPQRSEQILEEAGWKMGSDGIRHKEGKPLAFQLLISDLAPYPKISELVQADLMKVGAKVTIMQLEHTTYLTSLPKGEQEMFLWSYGVATGDAHMMLYPHLYSKLPFPTSRRYTFYENPKVDQLLNEGLVSLDQSKRREVYKKVQEMLKEDFIWIPLYQSVDTFLLKKNIRGFTAHPGEHIRFWNTYFA